MEQILILGGGGHARSLADTLEREGHYKIAGYVINDVKNGDNIDYPIIGTDGDLEDLFQSGIRNAAIGIGFLGKSDLREKLYKKLIDIGFYIPIVCDPSAVISKHTQIGEGTVIGKGAIINSGAIIGKMCIVNSGAIIEHDCTVGDFSHISVGSVLCGEVKVGEMTFVGANATVIQGKSIGEKCIIGAGTTVRHNVESYYMCLSKEPVQNIHIS